MDRGPLCGEGAKHTGGTTSRKPTLQSPPGPDPPPTRPHHFSTTTLGTAPSMAAPGDTGTHHTQAQPLPSGQAGTC